MNIITLTLNPAFDVHYTVDEFKPFAENYVSKISVQSGGKGINVSGALKSAGAENTAYVVVGERDFDSFSKGLDIKCKFFLTDGEVRRNITVHTHGMPETRLSTDNFVLKEGVFDKVKCELYSVCGDDTVVVFSGRIPKGVGIDNVTDMLVSLREKGTKIVCDSNSLSLDDLLKIKPWLVKPNEHEVKKLHDGEFTDFALELFERGIENVMVSLGERGIYYYGKNHCFTARPPKIDCISTIGAGDSAIAGFISAYAKGADIESSVKYAVAFGTASCLTQGTNPPAYEDIASIFDKVEISY